MDGRVVAVVVLVVFVVVVIVVPCVLGSVISAVTSCTIAAYMTQSSKAQSSKHRAKKHKRLGYPSGLRPVMLMVSGQPKRRTTKVAKFVAMASVQHELSF